MMKFLHVVGYFLGIFNICFLSIFGKVCFFFIEAIVLTESGKIQLWEGLDKSGISLPRSLEIFFLMTYFNLYSQDLDTFFWPCR